MTLIFFLIKAITDFFSSLFRPIKYETHNVDIMQTKHTNIVLTRLKGITTCIIIGTIEDNNAVINDLKITSKVKFLNEIPT